MNVTIKTGRDFERQAHRLAKKYKSLKQDLLSLRQELLDNPFQGVELGRGVRKIRLAISSKGGGKSGGARVLTLTLHVSDNANVTLLTIYDKSEIGNVRDEFITWLLDNEKNQRL